MTMKRLKKMSAALVTAFLGMLGAAQVGAAGDYLLATASTGGTYYPVGVALSTMVKVKLHAKNGINMSAINSAGSAENIRLLRDDQAHFALVQALYGAYAWNGTGPLKNEGPQKGLRAITMLWQDVEHFLISSKHVKTGTISDALVIKGVAGFGKKQSGSLGSSQTIFSNLGVEIDDQFDLLYGGYGALADAMEDGRADLINTPAGVPVGAVSKLMAAQRNSVRLLSFTDEQAAKADGGFDLWTPYVIPANTYPGQSSPVETIAQPNFLAVQAQVPEEDVYLITKTIYENLGFLGSIHKATRDMTIEKAITGLPIPLHPGAARYYREVGLDIPN